LDGRIPETEDGNDDEDNEDNEKDDIVHYPLEYHLDARTNMSTCISISPADNNTTEPVLSVLQYYFAIESSIDLHRTEIQEMENYLFGLVSHVILWCTPAKEDNGTRRRLSGSLLAPVQRLRGEFLSCVVPFFSFQVC
jgi:hypothetical protein